MTFGGNTQPKKKIKKQPTPWICHRCNIELPYWNKRCHLCEGYRNE